MYALIFISIDTGFVQLVIYITYELEVLKYMAGKIGTTSKPPKGHTKMLKSLIKYYKNILRYLKKVWH